MFKQNKARVVDIMARWSVCAIIPAKDAAGLIKECVDAALRDADHVVVVCDRCTDDTKDVARSAGAQTVISKQSWPHPDTHLGHRVADVRNVGLAAVPNNTDYVVFLDADTILPSGHIQRCTSIMDADASTGFVGMELDGSAVDTGGVARFDLFLAGLLGDKAPSIYSCAREGTCMTACIRAAGYRTLWLPYKNDGILRHTYRDDGWRHRAWESLGIGFAQYEMYRSFLYTCYGSVRAARTQHSLFPLLYPIGYLQGAVWRARRIERLQNTTTSLFDYLFGGGRNTSK